MSGPLAGITVLELAQIMAGPTCGMMLADMGANVIKVEKIPAGDDSRGYQDPRINGISAPFLILNRNKRGLALDLKNSKGVEVLKRLVAKADVLTENYRPGTMEKLGVGFEALQAINPRLIYAAVSGYGRSGPFAEKPGFDLIAQGFAGLMGITGFEDKPPAKTGNSVADINAGILACTGILAALVERARTGRGQLIETSLMEAAIQQTYWQAAVFFATGRSPGPLGSAHPLTAPYQAFRTKDGYINIGGANQANWRRIAECLGHPEWIADPRFETNSERMKHSAALTNQIEEVLARETTAVWMERFESMGVPVGPVHSIEQALSHPQVLARDMVVETTHVNAGRVKGIGHPIKFSASGRPAGGPAPEFGQHSLEVLNEFGFSAEEVQVLLEEGVIAQHSMN